jgi:hypothetical protein
LPLPNLRSNNELSSENKNRNGVGTLSEIYYSLRTFHILVLVHIPQHLPFFFSKQEVAHFQKHHNEEGPECNATMTGLHVRVPETDLVFLFISASEF